MNTLRHSLAAIDWQLVATSLHGKGYALLHDLLSAQDCTSLRTHYDDPTAYRKTVVMERYRFGLGEYKYYDYPLPEIVQTIRENAYPHLAPIANAWMHALNIPIQYPVQHADFLAHCHQHQQLKPTALILKYGLGGYNTLHQDLYGEVYFPLQLVLFLDQPGIDYEGGEFVLMQQTPRAQSKASVLQPKQGDMLIFTTNFRPVKGSKGYYRVNVKHGVSELHAGQRHTVGIIFHDATS